MQTLIETAFTKWITSIFGWLIALVLANGAMVHVMNILGKGKSPWSDRPEFVSSEQITLHLTADRN